MPEVRGNQDKRKSRKEQKGSDSSFVSLSKFRNFLKEYPQANDEKNFYAVSPGKVGKTDNDSGQKIEPEFFSR
jgi:hypothetical protein